MPVVRELQKKKKEHTERDRESDRDSNNSRNNHNDKNPLNTAIWECFLINNYAVHILVINCQAAAKLKENHKGIQFKAAAAATAANCIATVQWM